MKKINRTYVMGVVIVILAALIAWQTSLIPNRLVTDEPGPKLFPYIAAVGMGVSAILSMIFDGPKESKEDSKPYMTRAGWLRVALLMVECVLFGLGMSAIGFWLTSMIGLMVFFWTLKGDKKINIPFAIILSIGLGSLCYFALSRIFSIPLPKGDLWKMLGVKMP